MTTPDTISLDVPYADTEQQFVMLAVQAAVRRFRSMNPRSGEHRLRPSSQEAVNNS